MQIPLYQVDAFTRRVFGGNPAAVCPLAEWLDDATLQAIALENNLSDTAFFVRDSQASGEGRYHLRWFTPAAEVDLCGHATLASAFVLMNHIDRGLAEVVFDTRSGELRVTRENDSYSLDLPSRPPRRMEPRAELTLALRAEPDEVWLSRDYMAVYSSEQQIRALAPDFAKLGALDVFGVIVTAPGKDADFVSRFFAPSRGINEDPVTGSAHCTLIPYWSQRLGKTDLTAHQVSSRGGELFCRDRGDRVTILGAAALFATGTICL